MSPEASSSTESDFSTDSRFSIGHVHLKVADLDREIAFYTSHFDFEVGERMERFAFLTWGENHHDLALQEVSGARPDSASTGLYHVAFEVESESLLKSIYRDLDDADVSLSPVDHGISKALYLTDPSGNGLEIYVDTRTEKGTHSWEGYSRPFDPDADSWNLE